MTTVSQANENRGRYVLYSVDVDTALGREQSFIEKFKAEKIQELMSESSPYNLKVEQGRHLAITTIKEELNKIGKLAQECFQQARHDIAFSIVAEAVFSEK